MNRDEIERQVKDVLHTGFEVDPAKITPEAHLFFDLGIDSLDAIDMLVFLEERLGRSVDPSLFKEVRRVSDLYAALEKAATPEGESRPHLSLVDPAAPEPQPTR